MRFVRSARHRFREDLAFALQRFAHPAQDVMMEPMAEVALDGAPQKPGPETPEVVRRQHDLGAAASFSKLVRTLVGSERPFDAEVLFDHFEAQKVPRSNGRDVLDQVSPLVHAADETADPALVSLAAQRAGEQEPKDGPRSPGDIFEKHQGLPNRFRRGGQMHASNHPIESVSPF